MLYKLTIVIIFVFVSVIAKSQLCQGSLGDPVVNITFGAGANPGAPLAAATTDYTYSNTDCPNDGQYTIRNNTTACFGNTWHTITQDHTGNANGYFMLVNASYTPSDFYLDTVHGLCANTTYEFAAWILNVMNPLANYILPNLTFSIEETNGNVIQTLNTGDINATAVAQWNQYGVYFTTPIGITDVVLRIRNNAPGGNGNDLALDDITFRPCGPTVNIQSNSSSSNTNICSGDSAFVKLTGSVSPSDANTAYQWQWSSDNGNSWQNIIGATTLNYDTAYLLPANEKYRLLSAVNSTNITLSSCRIASTPYTFSLVTNPAIKATSNSPVCTEDTVLLNVSGGATYNWTGQNGAFNSTSSNIQFIAADTSFSGMYYVTGIDNNGCYNSDSVNVQINPSASVILKNNDTAICYGGSVNLIGDTANSTTFSWLPATGLNNNTLTPVATPSITTIYYLTANNQFNCSATDSVTVTVAPMPSKIILEDTLIVADEPLQLNFNFPFDSSYRFSWTPSTGMDDGNILNPIITLNSSYDTVIYLLTVSQSSCIIDTSSMKVIVFKTQPEIFVPSAFTPNNDRENDILKAIPVGIKQFDFFNIYNRLGQLIFTTQNSNTGWDGTLNGTMQPTGTYIFIAQGIDYTGKTITRKGTVVLLR